MPKMKDAPGDRQALSDRGPARSCGKATGNHMLTKKTGSRRRHRGMSETRAERGTIKRMLGR